MSPAVALGSGSARPKLANPNPRRLCNRFGLNRSYGFICLD